MTKHHHQLSLRLIPECPAALTTAQEKELLQALADLLLVVASAERSEQEGEVANDDQDR
jgi:hypothetical protein